MIVRSSTLAIATMFMAAGAAQAQDTAAPTAASAEGDGDIVVTAQRQSQSLQKVPLSITAVPAETIENLNIRNVDAIATVSSGVVLDTAFSFPTFYIRGVGQQNSPGVGLETPVAIYIDGAYNPRNTGTPFDLYDVSSVELLKGPQGTLYGRNASGGAILMKTADPTGEFGAKLAVEAGNFGHRQLDAMINLPASDTLSFRFAGRYRDDDGYVHNVFDGRRVRGRESYDIRGKMLWEPTPDFRALLTLDYHEDKGFALAVARSDSILTRTSPLKFNQVNSDFVITEPTESYNGNLNLQYSTGDITITNIFDYRHADAKLSDDNDHSPLPLVAINAGWGGTTVSNDLQVASSFGGTFDFMAGLLYAHDRGKSMLDLYGVAFGTPYQGSTVPAGAIPSRQVVVTEAYGGFAEVYIRPIDRMTITLGGRYSKDKRRITATAPAPSSQRFSDSTFTPRAVLAYEMDNVNLYASYTRGYLAGGFNIPTFAPQAPLTAETLDSYEIGAKFVSPDRRTRLNIAAFYYDYADLQVSVCCVSAAAVRVNAASARGKGVEIDFSHKASSWLNLGLGGAYLDATYRRFPGAAVFDPVFGDPAQPTVPTGVALTTRDISGSTLPRAPKWTGYANVSVEAPLGGDWVGRLNAVARYSSKFFFSPAGGGLLETDTQKSYAIVNLSGGVGPSSDAYEIGFYVDNLTDTKYYANRAAGAFGLDSRIASPRAYGLRVKVQM